MRLVYLFPELPGKQENIQLQAVAAAVSTGPSGFGVGPGALRDFQNDPVVSSTFQRNSVKKKKKKDK